MTHQIAVAAQASVAILGSRILALDLRLYTNKEYFTNYMLFMCVLFNDAISRPVYRSGVSNDN
jgi:hypothetical protein